MATVPGPKPDKPLPIPGAPAEEPQYEPEEEPGPVGPERGDEPEWLPKPYDPEREYEEPGVPIGGADLAPILHYRRFSRIARGS